MTNIPAPCKASRIQPVSFGGAQPRLDPGAINVEASTILPPDTSSRFLIAPLSPRGGFILVPGLAGNSEPCLRKQLIKSALKIMSRLYTSGKDSVLAVTFTPLTCRCNSMCPLLSALSTSPQIFALHDSALKKKSQAATELGRFFGPSRKVRSLKTLTLVSLERTEERSAYRCTSPLQEQEMNAAVRGENKLFISLL